MKLFKKNVVFCVKSINIQCKLTLETLVAHTKLSRSSLIQFYCCYPPCLKVWFHSINRVYRWTMHDIRIVSLRNHQVILFLPISIEMTLNDDVAWDSDKPLYIIGLTVFCTLKWTWKWIVANNANKYRFNQFFFFSLKEEIFSHRVCYALTTWFDKID